MSIFSKDFSPTFLVVTFSSAKTKMCARVSSRTALQGATAATVLDTVYAALYAEGTPKADLALTKDKLAIRECSGGSGAKTFLVTASEKPLCIVKVEGSAESKPALFNHPNSSKRIEAGARAFRDHGVAPSMLVTGPDFHVEGVLGTSVMKDYFIINPF